jgi:hypothetical protein
MVTGCVPLWVVFPRAAESARAQLARTADRLGAPPLAPDPKVAAATLAVATAVVALVGHVVAQDAFVTLSSHAAPLREDTHALQAPRARGIWTDPAQGRAVDGVVEYIRSRTAENEPVFFFPNEPMLYFLAERPNPTYYGSFYWDTFPPGGEKSVVEALRGRGVRYVGVRWPSGTPNKYDQSLSFDPAAAPIFEYVTHAYRQEARFGDYVVLGPPE